MSATPTAQRRVTSDEQPSDERGMTSDVATGDERDPRDPIDLFEPD
jgi:hypothetical protein